MTSGLTRGLPFLSRAIPGASLITFTWGRVITLSISEEEPPRRTMAFMGEPEDTSATSKPRAMESVATKTATTPAMPRTATALDDQRIMILRMLYIRGIAIYNTVYAEIAEYLRNLFRSYYYSFTTGFFKIDLLCNSAST